MLPVFLINLDRSTKRLEKSSTELKKYGISFTRVPAVDGANLSEFEINKWLAPDFSGYYKKLSPAEVGCYLSHIRCWQAIVDQGIDAAIILEDDFTLNDAFVDAMNHIKTAPIDWHCLKLTEHPQKRTARFKKMHGTTEFVVYDKVPSRTAAYAINRDGAKRMLAGSQVVSRPIDIEFQYWWRHNMKIWGVRPYPVDVSLSASSTIDSVAINRKKAPKSVPKQITEGVSFAIKNLWKTKRRVKMLRQQSR